MQFLIDFHEEELWQLLYEAGYRIPYHDIEKALDVAIEHRPMWKPDSERTTGSDNRAVKDLKIRD